MPSGHSGGDSQRGRTGVSRSRSRSPRDSRDRHRRRRSRSRSRHRHSHHHTRSDRKHRQTSPRPQRLPFNARQLSKHHLKEFRPLFARYLDIQKEIFLEDLDESEVKGRWKSFMKRWNRGELAEGWYDPETKRKSLGTSRESDTRSSPAPRQPSPDYNRSQEGHNHQNDYSSDEEIGPAPPGSLQQGRRAGPTIPGMQDLELRDELLDEDSAARLQDLRYARKVDRKDQKERLEELVPRADAGTHERKLEKKQEATATMRSYRDAKSPGAEEVREADLMGDDGIDGYKKQKKEAERKKNERELRKEEILRARAAEREERLAEHRAREDKTMDMLKALAKQRFG